MKAKQILFDICAILVLLIAAGAESILTMIGL